jgi:phosphoserine phosphatase RsbU/P
VIADVCNKGIGAALFMALFRTLFRFNSQQTHERERSGTLTGTGGATNTATARRLMNLLVEFNALTTVLNTNNYVAETHADSAMFATSFFAVLDVSTGMLTYVNGGHDAPAVIGPRGVKQRLELTGPVVGMAPNTEYETRKVMLEPGDILFCYTDGVTEAHVSGGAMFGERRMLSMIGEPTPSAAALVDRVDAALTAHYAGADPFDDITMLCVRRAPPGA